MNEKIFVVRDNAVYKELYKLQRANTRLTIFALGLTAYVYFLRKVLERHEREIKELKTTEEE